MNSQIYKISEPETCRKAGATDLIELLPAPGRHPLFIPRYILDILVTAITSHEICHISGPTGCAKTSLVETLGFVPDNFMALCRMLDIPPRPVRLFPIEMCVFETAGELFQRRAIKGGSTYDETSCLVQALDESSHLADSSFPVIFLREIGRVHSAAVQAGLINLLTQNEVLLPNNRKIDVSRIAWICDSNYAAEADSNAVYSLVPLDSALHRRFSIGLHMDYLSPEQEVQILVHLMNNGGPHMRGRSDAEETVRNIVKLGNLIRGQKKQGQLMSVPPPTIYGFMAMMRLLDAMSHMNVQQIASVTLLGNSSEEDQKLIPGLLNEVFKCGIAAETAADSPVAGGHLF